MALIDKFHKAINVEKLNEANGRTADEIYESLKSMDMMILPSRAVKLGLEKQKTVDEVKRNMAKYLANSQKSSKSSV